MVIVYEFLNSPARYLQRTFLKCPFKFISRIRYNFYYAMFGKFGIGIFPDKEKDSKPGPRKIPVNEFLYSHIYCLASLYFYYSTFTYIVCSMLAGCVWSSTVHLLCYVFMCFLFFFFFGSVTDLLTIICLLSPLYGVCCLPFLFDVRFFRPFVP